MGFLCRIALAVVGLDKLMLDAALPFRAIYVRWCTVLPAYRPEARRGDNRETESGGLRRACCGEEEGQSQRFLANTRTCASQGAAHKSSSTGPPIGHTGLFTRGEIRHKSGQQSDWMRLSREKGREAGGGRREERGGRTDIYNSVAMGGLKEEKTESESGRLQRQ